MTTDTDGPRCPDCRLVIPDECDSCPSCAAEARLASRRAARRAREAEERARLGTAPAERSLALARWAVASAAERLAVALRYASGAQEADLRRAADLVHRAGELVGRPMPSVDPADWPAP